MSLRAFGAGALPVLALLSPASAQTALSGPLSDATTGPLTAGVYTASTISVPAGETLTIDPGVIIKFGFDGRLDVDGTLLAQGTGANPVIFTDERDDVGGDTNGDGAATSPAAGWWRGLEFGSESDASVVEDTVVRYGGRFISGVHLVESDATFRDVAVTDFFGTGVDLTGSSFPTISGCAVDRCTNFPINNVPIAAVPGFSGLSGTGNPTGNRLRVTAGDVPMGSVVSIGPDNGFDGTVFLAQRVLVPNGSTLELQAGTVLKFGFDVFLDVDGELRAMGTPANRVTLTDERDDSVGGDTNGDGTNTSPAAGWWRGVTLTDGADASLLRSVDVRYGGRFIAAFEMTNCDATFEDVEVTDFTSDGLDFNASCLPSLDGVRVERCTGTPFSQVSLQALENFAGLSAQDNGRDWVDVTDAFVSNGEVLSIGPENGVHGGFRFPALVRVDPGGELTLRAGTIVKVGFDGRLEAHGQLHARGTQADPVRIVDERDDVGGDSNGDGAASSPAAGWWRGLGFADAADGSELEWLDVAYGGRFQAGLLVDGVGVSLDHCSVRSFSGPGMDFATTEEPCEVLSCSVTDCAGEAIDRVRLDRVPDFFRTIAQGNGQDRIRVTEGTVGSDVRIGVPNLVNRAIFIAAPVLVEQGNTLTLDPGVVLQMVFDGRIDVAGSLRVAASFGRPVIVTSETDTTVQLGAAGVAGTAGHWRGIEFSSTADPSEVRGLIVRNGGRFISNVNVQSASVSLRELRSERCSGPGFRFGSAPVVAERLAAVDCTTHGFQIDASTGVYRQLTSVGNASWGVNTVPGFAGEIRDSIAWGNGAGAFSVGGGVVRFSNGDVGLVGTDGNIFADPFFVDLAARDLHLTAGSPCIDAGDPASPMDENSTRADQGAYPLNDLLPEVFCAQVDDAFCEPSIST